MDNLIRLLPSRERLIGIGISLILVTLGVFVIFHRWQKPVIDPAFSKYIESYTTGEISKESAIRIRLAGDVQVSHEQNGALTDPVFDFSPSIKGKAYWVDARTIEFRPDKKLDPDKSYTADFRLNKIITVSDHFAHFTFSFQTIKPDFTVSFTGLQTATNTSTDKMKLGGIVQTADNEDPASIEKLININFPSPVSVSWQHNAVTKTHQFTVTGLTRENGKVNPLTVSWDGSSLNVGKKGSQDFLIPAIGDFKVLDIRAVQDNDQYVLVEFSDAIMVGQELNGLIGIGGVTDAAYTIDGSTVKVYAPERLDGNFSVFVNEGVENISHKKITKTYSANVFFENRLPTVTIPGTGVILPDSGKLMMPFEAVNLNAVDVSIIKIYEDNVPQYFQNNGFDGGDELRHVGKPVVQKTIRLDDDKSLNLNKKNRFMLDIDQLMRTEPGAIYRVIIGFRKEYSIYNCSAGKPELIKGKDEGYEDEYENGGSNTAKISDEDDNFWARYDNYYPDGFNWQERQDPCTNSYFTKDRWATRNIIASNIGLIAKRGNNNSMLIAVTNILTAKPMAGVDLEILDFQKQVILKTTSDRDGFARFDLKRKPYLLVAVNGSERGYLKLDDGSSLPLSRFNVGGEVVQSGLKGFLYGERGVWRPGDSIYMSFILEDKLKTLPADHPVQFELYDPNGKLYRRITQTGSIDGFYSFHTATETSSPTGNWSALKPVISMPDKIRPETKSSVTISEASGKEMTYTIAIVDEGLLDITNYKTPDPHEAFYAREALGVKTWDLFDYVIGAYGGGLERILSIGGDGTAGTNHNVSVNRFKPVVKFLGPFRLGRGDKQTQTFTLPQYIGSVKVMVIAGHDGSYGFADKYVAVKKPLMILPTLPRVLGPSEKVQLPVTVFAMENNIKTVSVQVQSNAFSNLAGNNLKTVTFAKTGDQLVTFDLDVKDFVGVGKVKITAKSGKETSTFDVELNIRNPNPPITKILEKELQPGETWNTAYSAIGISGTNKATLEVASIPPLNLTKRLDYLIEYPYGCVEQTTSSAFPQLYLDQLLDLTPRQKAETERNIKATINRLNGFQVTGGGLTYWPGYGEPDEWGTNYAGHFMLAAQAKGYNLPLGFIEAWKRYQKQKAVTWAPDSRSFYGADLDQAYRLYLLAMARAPELGAMNRLREFPYLSVEARWRLAAAYKLAGQPEIGLQMIRSLPITIKPYNSMYGTYGSDLRDEAMILETLTLLGQQQKAAGELRIVASRLSQDEWYSTQTTAYSLIAIAQYCGKNKTGAKLVFNYQSGGSKAGVNSASYLWQAPLAANGSKVSLTNTGKNRLYLRLIQKGQPSSGLDVQSNINPDILEMRVGYFTLGGKEIDPASLKQGTDFVAQVNIKNPGKRGRYDNLALTQIFPSGWEILNTRMLGGEEAFKSSESNYRDIRDDRVYTYFSLPEDKTVTYYVMLNAAYAGKYYLPATYCEAMYEHSISALLKGEWVEVVK